MNADSEKILALIIPILNRGNNVEIKYVYGELQIVEIQRKLKHRMTVTTG